MFENCLAKQEKIKKLFNNCSNVEDKYQLLIELGRQQTHVDALYKTEEYEVKGCQSRMYLRSFTKDGYLYFESESDALISAGLCVLLLKVYDGETPETILKCPPDYLDELGIYASLTPGRANGLASLYLRMKQDALKAYMELMSKNQDQKKPN